MRRFALSIVGWAEYQERPDRANYNWFKFHQKTITGHLWANSTLEQKAMWIALLCIRNAQQDDIIHTQDFVLAGYCGVKPTAVPKILSGLMELGAILDVSRMDAGKIPEVSRQIPGLELELEKKERREEEKGPAEFPPLPPALAARENEFSSKAKQLLGSIKDEAMVSLWESYPNADYFVQEANKAANWILANPKKASKNFGKFFGNWLGRGWDAYRKTIPSNAAVKSDINWGKVFGEPNAS